MAAEKRPASNSFGESQIVKRQRSDVDFGTTNAVALGNGTPQNGTLTQTVRPHIVAARWSFRAKRTVAKGLYGLADALDGMSRDLDRLVCTRP